MIKLRTLVWRLLTEPFRRNDLADRPLRWRLGMRWNHIHHHLKSHWPKLYNFRIQLSRQLICRPFGHRWPEFEAIKYGSFGISRTCKVCHLHHTAKNSVNTYHDTHRPGGWVEVARVNADD